METRRDVAVVLSGGGVNGVLLELGFLRRLHESPLWPRIGCIFGTSAGALTGTCAALDRLDDLERFLLSLQPHETFRPQRLWRTPLLGLNDYTLPQTIAERLGDPTELARELAGAPVELVVCATDLTDDGPGEQGYELTYPAWTTPPEIMGQAVLASAAISALVFPLRVGDRIATDGGWVRNYPLGHAYDRPGVGTIVAFRYVPEYRRLGTEALVRLRERLQRVRAVPPVRAFVEELRQAEERERGGEPVHLGDMLIRLMRVAIQRNTELEERSADEQDASLRALASLRADMLEIVREHARPARRRAAVAAVERRFTATRFPFSRDRELPRITVRATAGKESLEVGGLRSQQPWTEDAKRVLIERGYALTDAVLEAEGLAEPLAS
jgi:predicted acylesterase/phospholipase RssA